MLVNLTSTATTCGLSNGTITATITNGGISPYDFRWSNGLITMNTVSNFNSISNLQAGSYSVTITDNNNCTATGSVTVAASTPVTAGFTYNGNQCRSGNSFNFTNTGTSGVGSYCKSFRWFRFIFLHMV
ncbi:MAG: hypothetical protein HY738_00490 [Bacteroidia bacterium]|nr:hypothetical protein [Bacteroidia bacterium]